MKKVSMVLALILLLGGLAGCGSAVSKSEASKFADAPTEQMLLATNDDNYKDYIEYTDAQFRKAVSEDRMKQGNEMIRSKIGTYVPSSKKFKDASRGQQKGLKFIAVRYNAKFTKEKGAVIITMIFDDNSKHQVAGIFADSPKLRE